MKLKHKMGRTKSESMQEQHNENDSKRISYSAHMNFKPFSEECTLNQIEEKLSSFKSTMVNPKYNPKRQNQSIPLAVRLKKIINNKNRSIRRKRANLTEMDIRTSQNSHQTQNLQQKFKVIQSKSNSLKRISIKQPEQEQEVLKQRFTTISNVRHNLSQQAADEQSAFFDMIHKPKSSILLANFNKNNHFLFSRSKHKVYAIQQQKTYKQIQIPSRTSKFQSFGTYFYGSYMKKYTQRRRLLGKKGTLIKMVAK